MSPDIISIGELLVDLIALEKNVPLKKVNRFQKFPGGAPANVSVAISSLGVSSGLITKVGEDPFGEFLIQFLTQKKVDTSQIFKDNVHHTGIVFVESQEGVPGFMLYSDVAYNFLKPDEIDLKYIKNSKLLNFGGVFLLKSPARDAVMRSLTIAKDKIPIAFDINLRSDLLRGQHELWEYVNKSLTFVDILKISTDELLDLYLYLNPQKGDSKFEQAINFFVEAFHIKIIALTLGGAGSKMYVIKNNKTRYEIMEPVYKVKVTDSTGAGDAFLGGLLASLVRLNQLENLEDIKKEDSVKILKFCNKYAGLSTTQIGAWNLPQIKIPF